MDWVSLRKRPHVVAPAAEISSNEITHKPRVSAAVGAACELFDKAAESLPEAAALPAIAHHAKDAVSPPPPMTTRIPTSQGASHARGRFGRDSL